MTTAVSTVPVPAEGRCDGCLQPRPVWEYQPQYPGVHGDEGLPQCGSGCEWCTWKRRLCARCYSSAAELEVVVVAASWGNAVDLEEAR